jgi:hypothetical protein
MKRESLDRVVTGLNLDRKAVQFLDLMAVETRVSRSQIVNYLIESMMLDLRLFKKIYPNFKEKEMLQFLKKEQLKIEAKRKPRAA